ncbi:MAG: hypothetical protein R3A10_21585 [Caldilineaceae bacterium]
MPETFAPYIDPDYLQNFRRIERYVIDDAIDMANTVIRVGKELQLTPETLQRMLNQQRGTWPLLDFGLRIYADYQRSLQIRGAVDFDDLIVLALQALRADEGLSAAPARALALRARGRSPGFEPVAGDHAAPAHQQQRQLGARVIPTRPSTRPSPARTPVFCASSWPATRAVAPLPNSGRSALPIIDAANHLIDWSIEAHPTLPPDLALAKPLYPAHGAG